MNAPRDVGAVWARTQYGAKIRLDVLLYCVDPDRNLWAFTVRDRRQEPIVRSVAPRRDVPGVSFAAMGAQLETLLGVAVDDRPNGRGLIRTDRELTVAVRTIESSTEIPFRSDAL